MSSGASRGPGQVATIPPECQPFPESEARSSASSSQAQGPSHRSSSPPPGAFPKVHFAYTAVDVSCSYTVSVISPVPPPGYQ